jgi:CRP-like cAMP-binding protein
MQRLNLFAGLAKEEIEALAGRLHDQVWQRRQLILDPESAGDRIYLVKTGAVRVYQISAEGRELTTAILRPGQLLGTAALAGISQQGASPKRSSRRRVSAMRQPTSFCG